MSLSLSGSTKVLFKQVCVQLLTSADNVTLLAFAADRRAAVDMDRKAVAPAADAPCSNRSISPARGAHSSKPAAHCCSGRQMKQTDGRTPYRYRDPAAYYASDVINGNIVSRLNVILFVIQQCHADCFSYALDGIRLRYTALVFLFGKTVTAWNYFS